MGAYEAENTLILSGGNRGYITNMNQRVPIHYDSLHRHDDLSYFTFTYKSRNTDNPTGEWNDLLLRHRPLSRLNAAGCILNELKIMIVDGGSGTQVRDEEDPDQLSTNTFVLDMEKYSPKSWIWSSRIGRNQLRPFAFLSLPYVWPKRILPISLKYHQFPRRRVQLLFVPRMGIL